MDLRSVEDEQPHWVGRPLHEATNVIELDAGVREVEVRGEPIDDRARPGLGPRKGRNLDASDHVLDRHHGVVGPRGVAQVEHDGGYNGPRPGA